MKQHKWISKVWGCRGKEDSFKRLRTARSHVCDFLEKAELQWEQICGYKGLEQGENVTIKGQHESFLGRWNCYISWLWCWVRESIHALKHLILQDVIIIFLKKAVPEECDEILIYTCLLTTRKHLKPYFKKMYQATRLWPLMVIRESRYSGTTWRISFLASIPLSLSTEQGDLHFPIQGYQFSPQNWLSRLGKRRENVFRNDVYWSRFACILWGVHKAIILYWYDTHTFVQVKKSLQVIKEKLRMWS